MANPNILNATSITGKTVAANLTTTSANTIVNNPSGSSQLIKINTLTIANRTSAADYITVNFNNNANLGGTNYFLIYGQVPAYSALTAIDKNTQIYLEENQSIGVIGATGNVFTVTCSYEVIS